MNSNYPPGTLRTPWDLDHAAEECGASGTPQMLHADETYCTPDVTPCLGCGVSCCEKHLDEAGYCSHPDCQSKPTELSDDILRLLAMDNLLNCLGGRAA